MNFACCSKRPPETRYQEHCKGPSTLGRPGLPTKTLGIASQNELEAQGMYISMEVESFFRLCLPENIIIPLNSNLLIDFDEDDLYFHLSIHKIIKQKFILWFSNI